MQDATDLVLRPPASPKNPCYYAAGRAPVIVQFQSEKPVFPSLSMHNILYHVIPFQITNGIEALAALQDTPKRRVRL